MTRIKLCGLSRRGDIDAANRLKPEYIGFVFWEKSRRHVDRETAKKLKEMLSGDIKAVGVFVNEDKNIVAELLNDGTADIAQLHGSEDEDYIKDLRRLTEKPIIKAFVVKSESDIIAANRSSADYVLLDAGMGEGEAFNHALLKLMARPYFLAGGLSPDNVKEAVLGLHPFAVDVSSGIETDGHKDAAKMSEFVANVRSADK